MLTKEHLEARHRQIAEKCAKELWDNMQGMEDRLSDAMTWFSTNEPDRIILSAITDAITAQQKVIEDLEAAVKRHVERIDRLEELLTRWIDVAKECNPEAAQAISQMMDKMGVAAPLVPTENRVEKGGEGNG